MAGRLTRRSALSVIGATGGAVGAGIAGSVAWARDETSNKAILLVDQRIGAAKGAEFEHLSAGKREVALEKEVVRQWRSDLSSLLEERGALDAIVLWDNVNLLSGLARENGANVKRRRIAANIHYLEIHQSG